MMGFPFNQPLRISCGPDCGIARAFVEKWFEWRDVPRFGQVQLSVAELRGSMSSYAEPHKARPARVRCACGEIKLALSVCDVYDRR